MIQLLSLQAPLTSKLFKLQLVKCSNNNWKVRSQKCWCCVALRQDEGSFAKVTKLGKRILSLKVDRLLCDQLSSPLPVKPTLQYILHCSVPYICFCSIHISPSCNTCFTLMLNTFEIHFTVVRPTQLSITSSEAVQTHHTALQCNPILCIAVCSVLHSAVHCSVQYLVHCIEVFSGLQYPVHWSIQCIEVFSALK